MKSGLSSGYTVEIDNAGKGSWNNVIERFNDASIYQAWSYEAMKSGEKNLSHLVLKRDGAIVAAAQVRITRLPMTRIGAAYVRWGPMWQLRGSEPDLEVFEQALRALRNEYACRRGLVVRILPALFNDQSEHFKPVLERVEFMQPSHENPQRTLLVNLKPSIEDLRKGLHEKWRYNLKKAEKNNLKVVEGFDDDLFRLCIDIYKETHGRKKFMETSDVHQFRKIQHDLPDRFKMRLLVAFADDKPAAGVICSGIGDMGTFLFGGTSDAGLRTYGSYLLQWKALTWLKEQGATWYNLAGINPVKNPGTHRFKAGLCGKNGKDVFFVGAYDACDSASMSHLFRLAGSARAMYRKGKLLVNRLQR